MHVVSQVLWTYVRNKGSVIKTSNLRHGPGDFDTVFNCEIWECNLVPSTARGIMLVIFNQYYQCGHDVARGELFNFFLNLGENQ